MVIYFRIISSLTTPIHCNALYNAKQCGVNIWCIKARFTKRDMTFISEIPINFKP